MLLSEITTSEVERDSSVSSPSLKMILSSQLRSANIYLLFITRLTLRFAPLD